MANADFESLETELQRLTATLTKMGGLAEDLLGSSIDTVMRRDNDFATNAISVDEQIDELEVRIETMAVEIIARRQPAGLDLRELIASMRIAGDLERVGDLGKNIAKRARVISTHEPLGCVATVQRMGDAVLSQVDAALAAYVNRDVQAALAVRANDERIDEYYNSVFRELVTYMIEDPRNIGQATHLLFVSKNLERAGDHATNIAETVQYLLTGVRPHDDRPKSDETSETSLSQLRGGHQ